MVLVSGAVCAAQPAQVQVTEDQLEQAFAATNGECSLGLAKERAVNAALQQQITALKTQIDALRSAAKEPSK